ncbi:MAG: hypothetical protein WC008_00775 [Bacilli bacterium]
MKRNFKFLIILLATLIVTAGVNVKASSGYTYNHRGEPIYSTTGFTINQLPYLAQDLGIDNKDFRTPEDMFIYEDDNNQKVIYLIDSTSNKLFVFNESFQLLETKVSFHVDVDNFTDDELDKMKSSGSYVIAKDTILTIPANQTKVNIANGASQVIDYELADLDFTYELDWESNDTDIVTLTDKDDVLTLNAVGVGVTTVKGTLTQIEEVVEVDELGNETTVFERTVLVEVNIEVSTDPEEVLVPAAKNNSFSINELRGIGSFDLYLNGVVGVYRAKNPNTGEDYIYLSDKNNNQVVILDSITYEVVQVVTKPTNATFESRAFSPKELITDGAGRLYIIADNVNEGIMQFSKEGSFHRFVGVNYVTLSPWDIFWRNLATDEQLAKQSTLINTSFTALAVDNRGFIYAASYALRDDDGLVTNDNAMIKKLNTVGDDGLRRNGYQPPKGDVVYVQGGTETLVRGPSKFAAITVNDYGMYTILDKKMGKLFTYDNEGRLLYISGDAMYIEQESGKQINTLANPVSVNYLNDNIVVLDKKSSAIIVYEPTDIGALINEAAKLEFVGDKKTAATIWERVVKLNANYEYGYVGIGQMYMDERDYKTAMFYFERGANRDLYSKAYKLHRDAQIREYFGPVAIVAITLIGARIAYNVFIKKKHKIKDEDGFGD